METNLLDRMLGTYLSSMSPVTIILQNKIRVTGTIKAFDSYVIIIENQKREIVYRHAVSSIAVCASEEVKKTSSSADKSSRGAKMPAQRPRSPQQASLPASPSEMSINNGMKEGLLKWMQEQKAAK